MSQVYSMSIKTDKTLCLFAMDLWIASWRRRRWSVVLQCCRKPDCKIWRQGRIKRGQRGQLPRAPRYKGAPRDEIFFLFQIKYSVEKFSWFRSDTRKQLYYIPMFCQVWRAPNNNWFFYIRSGEPNYYRGPHELCIIAGGPQNQQILS